MHTDCQAALADFLERNLKPSEARDAEDMVNLQMRLLAQKDPQAWLAMPAYERLQAGAKAAADQLVSDLKLKQRQVALQIAAHDRIEGLLAAAFKGVVKPGARQKIISDLLAFNPVPHGIQSAETTGNAIAKRSFGELTELWNSVKGFAHLFEDRQGVHDLVHELFGEDTGNAAAKAGAQAWMRTTDRLRDRANAAGQHIGQLEDWHIPQSHSQGRIATAGFRKWSADTLPLLGRDRYLNPDGTRMTDEQLMRGLMPASFDSITMGGENKHEPGTIAGKAIGGIANRGAAHRALFFKDADAYLTYQGLYGEQSLWSVLTSHVQTTSRDIGLLETLGSNPDQTFRYFNDRTLQEELRANPAQADKIRRQYTFNQALFDTVAGRRTAVNQRVAAAGQAFRNFETAVKLPRVVITALGDEAGMAATAFANKLPWTRIALQQLTPGEWRDAAAHSGVGVNSMIGGLNRFGQEDMRISGDAGSIGAVRNFTSKLATGVLNGSGAEFMWDNRRKALGAVLQSYLGKWVSQVEHFKDLSTSDHGMLASKGITEADWQVWKRAELEDWGMEHGVLTPLSVDRIPDAKLADLGNPEMLRRHAGTALLGHILEETGMGVMDTGARERTSMLFGTTPGTAAGELTRAAFLFKSFSVSMMMKHWARAASLPSGNATAAYVARLLVVGTVMGALATQLRNLTAGKDPANIAEPRFWAESLLRGGGMGVYGDFLYSELSTHDTSPVEILGGPVMSTLADVWNLTGAAAIKAARGERTDEGAKLVRFLRGNVPMLNLWYLQAAMDHLIWNEMQESASPGYLDRMKAKAYAQRGTSYWWDPGEQTPHAGPDFAKAWQPEMGRDQLNRVAQATGMGTE